MPYLVIGNLESPWLWLALIAVFLIFGNKLPQLARSLGSSFSEFKKGVKTGEQEGNAAAAEDKKEAVDAEKK